MTTNFDAITTKKRFFLLLFRSTCSFLVRICWQNLTINNMELNPFRWKMRESMVEMGNIFRFTFLNGNCFVDLSLVVLSMSIQCVCMLTLFANLVPPPLLKAREYSLGLSFVCHLVEHFWTTTTEAQDSHLNRTLNSRQYHSFVLSATICRKYVIWMQ